jgi:TRAP-type uncharacterized transport system substrate-binding protein
VEPEGSGGFGAQEGGSGGERSERFQLVCHTHGRFFCALVRCELPSSWCIEEALKGDFDIVAGFLASPSMNPESSLWTTLSQKFDLYFLELPEDLLKLIAQQNVDAEFVEVHNGLLRGVDRRIKTLGRSGEAIFARDDTPGQAAYDLAKAIDENHGALKWFIRVYTYDPKTVWQNFGVPLHLGAEKYYREVAYMKK